MIHSKHFVCVARFVLRRELTRPFGTLDIFIREMHRVSRVENDPDRCHVADVAVRGAGRDQQKIAGLEHVLALIRTSRTPSRELKRNFVLAKAAVINPLRVGAVGRFDHDVDVFHQLEMFATGTAFLYFVEHRRWLEQGALFIRDDAFLHGIALGDLNWLSRVNDQSRGRSVAAVFMGDIWRYDQNIALGQFEIAFGSFGDSSVLYLYLGFAKPSRAAAIRCLV